MNNLLLIMPILLNYEVNEKENSEQVLKKNSNEMNQREVYDEKDL